MCETKWLENHGADAAPSWTTAGFRLRFDICTLNTKKKHNEEKTHNILKCKLKISVLALYVIWFVYAGNICYIKTKWQSNTYLFYGFLFYSLKIIELFYMIGMIK